MTPAEIEQGRRLVEAVLDTALSDSHVSEGEFNTINDPSWRKDREAIEQARVFVASLLDAHLDAALAEAEAKT